MNSRGRVFFLFVIGLVMLTGLSLADVLRLKDGRRFTGTYLGGDSRTVRFMTEDGSVRTFFITDVSALSFGREPAPAARSAPPEPGSAILIPQGTVVSVRMIDPVDSDVNLPGDTFRGTLEEALIVGARTVAPKGAEARVKLISVKQSGKLAGSDEVALELQSLEVDGRTYSTSSSFAHVASEGKGKQTAKVVGGTTALGAIIGAIAGGGKGAAIGAVTGAGAGTAVQVLRGKRVKVPSEAVLAFSLSEPVRVQPEG